MSKQSLIGFEDLQFMFPIAGCQPLGGWWSQTGSNRRPHACKARALPTELWPLQSSEARRQSSAQRWQRSAAGLDDRRLKLVVLGRLELPTSRLSSARSNQLSYKPEEASSQRPAAQMRANSRRKSEGKRRRRQGADIVYRRCLGKARERS